MGEPGLCYASGRLDGFFTVKPSAGSVKRKEPPAKGKGKGAKPPAKKGKMGGVGKKK